MRILKSRVAIGLLLAVFYLTLLPFVLHGFGMISIGLSHDAPAQSYLFADGQSVGNAAMILHIFAGTVLVILVPLQLVRALRQRFNWFHRALGVVLIALALITGLAGMTYIPLRGTIGGPVMTAGFFLYGLCLFASALMLARMALSNDRAGHWAWGLRLFWLALGSWLYRVHYTLWYLLTGGLGSEPDFSGPFDLVQNFAFFVPYLLAAQIWIMRKRSEHQGALVTGP
ncbi:DUF2306 domain-containing protein [Ruegeria sp. HKCCD4332]|uniref:DUF2306 domain-containing protein n=1 Tax=Ruegeria sp. HKCCD4332 TaxID=2683021 RepID=UPI0014926791|nr:DUF2306 domain-containing protein [Ruegeria sp. HKCCD4332]NOD76325.1 DUF2306 domain-containing protein [Ruegeria sp. HKCCD4332]